MGKEYRKVPGHPRYRVAADGEVQSSRRGTWATLKGCLREIRGHAYRAYFLTDDSGRFRYSYGHSLVAAAFLGETPPGLEVCFKNGDRSDCRLENLYFGKADRRKKKDRLTAAEEASHSASRTGPVE